MGKNSKIDIHTAHIAKQKIDLVTAFSSLFDELEPETPEEVDATLREFGHDPDELGARMKVVAEEALKRAEANYKENKK